ncbi:MAG TPA: ABC transporter substrate-binding protein [Anaeromyxobacter sp.]|nr:ABC transporter substrate-binding protein [Anaeromyxobacter sp.]
MPQRLRGLVLAAGLLLPPPGLAVEKVKLGFVNSMTGPEAPIGENLTHGADLAVEDLRREGIEVELSRQDDGGKQQNAMSAVEELATGEGVAAIVGPYTSASANAVVSLAQQYQVPLLIPAAAKEELTRPGKPYVFRLNAPAHVYAEALLDAVLAVGKPRTIAFIYESTDFGTSVSAAGKELAARRGLRVVADEAYQQGAPDYRSTLTRIKALRPDLVFMVSYVADAILLMRQSRELRLEPQAFLGGGAGFDTAQFQGEHDISELVFSVTQWTPDTGWPGAAEFAARYAARFGKKPTYHAACAYEAVRIAAQAAARVGGDPRKTRDALAAGSFSGVLGAVRFESFDGFMNQNRHAMPVIQYQDGRAQTVSPPEFARRKPVYPFPGWK